MNHEGFKGNVESFLLDIREPFESFSTLHKIIQDPNNYLTSRSLTSTGVWLEELALLVKPWIIKLSKRVLESRVAQSVNSYSTK
jgi:hypothetical protein